MTRMLAALVFAMTLLGTAHGARAQADCQFIDQWVGTPVRRVGVAATPTRTLIWADGVAREVDAAGAEVPVELVPGADQVLGDAGGFWRIRTDLASTVVVTRPQSTGDVTVTLGTSVWTMNSAIGAVGDGVLAVAWARPLAQYGTEHDVHLAVLRADATVAFTAEVPARAGAYGAWPVVSGGVVWLVWREDPYLRIVGQRYTLDGTPLDTEPREFARDINTVDLVPIAGGVRMYAYTPSGTIDVYQLAADGAATARGPFAGPYRAVRIGTGDAVVHLGYPTDGADLFPTAGEIPVVRESSAGDLTPVATLVGADVAAAALGGDVLIASAVDTAAATTGASTLEVRRLPAAAALGPPQPIVANPFAIGPVEYCDDPYDGCSAGGGRAGTLAVVVLALAVAGRGRRRARVAP